MSNLEIFNLENFVLLYYVFAIREIFITKTLKAMNLQKF